MSGHSVPYQLRTNKFVERQLFLDLLDCVRVWNGPSQYIYASMGGRFLEDFKQVNDRYAIEQMISIEGDKTTCDRQKYNRLGFIECRNEMSSQFVQDMDRLKASHEDKIFIVWLDFTEANKRGKQLAEYRELVSKLSVGDVVKVTLNANFQSFRKRSDILRKKDFDSYLKDADSETHKDFETYLQSILGRAVSGDDYVTERILTLSDSEHEKICLKNLDEQLDNFKNVDSCSPEILTKKAFAEFLSQSIKIAALKGIGQGLTITPLSAFRYQDGEHQMLTSTAIISDDVLKKKITTDAVFEQWPFRSNKWNEVHEINVPDLSPKERHLIDGLLSDDLSFEDIHDKIPFRFDKKNDKSLAFLKEYVQHYRRYPTFGRVQS